MIEVFYLLSTILGVAIFTLLAFALLIYLLNEIYQRIRHLYVFDCIIMWWKFLVLMKEPFQGFRHIARNHYNYQRPVMKQIVDTIIEINFNEAEQ